MWLPVCIVYLRCARAVTWGRRLVQHVRVLVLHVARLPKLWDITPAGMRAGAKTLHRHIVIVANSFLYRRLIGTARALVFWRYSLVTWVIQDP